MADRNLTTKQQLFAEAYLANPNATAAARKAGYKGTANALGVIGNKMLRNTKIASLVQKRIAKAVMSADEVLAELSDIGKSEWRDHIEVRYKDDGTIDVQMRLTDKIKALDLVGKYHNLFNKTEVTIKNSTAIADEVVARLIENGYTSNEAHGIMKEIYPEISEAIN